MIRIRDQIDILEDNTVLKPSPMKFRSLNFHDRRFCIAYRGYFLCIVSTPTQIKTLRVATHVDLLDSNFEDKEYRQTFIIESSKYIS